MLRRKPMSTWLLLLFPLKVIADHSPLPPRVMLRAIVSFCLLDMIHACLDDACQALLGNNSNNTITYNNITNSNISHAFQPAVLARYLLGVAWCHVHVSGVWDLSMIRTLLFVGCVCHA